MTRETEEKVLGILGEYRRQDLKYKELEMKMEQLRNLLAGLESDRLRMHDELEAIRAKEKALVDELKVKEGFSEEEFKAEVLALTAKIF